MIEDKDGNWIYAPFHEWFGLTYSAYLVLPRAILEALPEDLQHRLIACIDEAKDLIDCDQINDNYSVKLRDSDGRYMVDPFANYRYPPKVPFKEAAP